MSLSIAFLRGINLGRRRVTNDALRAAFEAIGFGGVSVYRASGNVLFDDPGDVGVAARIESGLRARFGWEVPAFVRTAAQVVAITAFDGLPRIAGPGGKLQVTLLRAPPGRAAQAQVLALATAHDRLAFGDAELFWLPEHGVGKSELDVPAVERLLGPGTTRTMGTMESLAQRCR